MLLNELFIQEASNLSASELTKSPQRIATFLNKIRRQSPFVKTDGTEVVLDPSEAQRLEDILNNNPRGVISVKTKDGGVVNTGALAKTSEFGGQQAGGAVSAEEIKFNKGEVAEGYHAAAAFARLIKRPASPVVENDIAKIIGSLGNNQTLKVTAKEENSPVADEFHLTVSLKPGSWSAFKEPVTMARMKGILKQILEDANNETGYFADAYAKNGRFDFVQVIGDGVSGETETKTDVTFVNKTEKKFADYSLKVGTTKQIHQVGGGAVAGAKKASPEERFNILQSQLFNVDDRFPLADITPVRKQFLELTDNEERQELAYRAAVISLNKNLETPDEERTFLKNLIGALKYWMVRDDENIKLKQFTGSKTYILDAKRFDDLLKNEDLDLVAEYVDGKATPELTIKDKNSGAKLITIRTYRTSSGYLRNYVEKEALFVKLTNISKGAY